MTRLPIAIALLVLLAGCSGYIPSSSDTSQDSYPPIEGFHVQNDDDQPHTVDLVLMADGKVIAWERVTLNSTSENERGTTVVDSEHLTPIALPTQQNFTVFFRVDSGTGTQFAPYSPNHVTSYQNCLNGNNDTAHILLMVNRDGTVSPGVACVNN